MPAESLRIGVIGCGSIGQRHLRNLQALSGADLIAYDISPAACRQVQQDLGLVATSTPGEFWDAKPQVVFITTPTQDHLSALQAAIDHKCHVFIEKPLSHDLTGIANLCRRIDEERLITMVGCNMRFHPGPATVKRLLASGRIGEVIAARIQGSSYLPFWRPQQDYRQSYSASTAWGGAILDYIHEIDLALWYLGPARLLFSTALPAQAIGLETDGLADIILRHENNVLSDLHLNFIQRDYRRTCQIIGSQGTIYWDFSAGEVTIFGKTGILEERIPQPEGWQVNQMFLDELAYFLDRIAQGMQTENSILASIPALNIALAARNGAGL